MDKIDNFIKNPKKALFTLASPIIIATVVQTLYNIVDTAYVGRLGASALAGISFCFPLFFILIAVNSGINAGMSSRISRFLGEKKKKEAENAAIHGLLLASVVGIIISIIGYFTMEPVFLAFGATGESLKQAMDYMGVVYISTIFMFISYVYNGIFGAQGDTKTPMIIQLVALVLNAILDPILIFGFNLGIMGASIATGVSFVVSLIMYMMMIKKRSYLHIHIKNFKFSWKLIKEIFTVGLPASIIMLIISIYVIFLNRVMVKFSTNHVAAFGMASRLESVALMPLVGFSISLLTLVGMFYGAKRYDLVKMISWYAIKLGLLVSSAFAVLFLIFPGMFFGIFTSDKALLAIAVPYMRIDVFTFPLMTISMIISRIMQALGKGMPGLLINLVRIFLVAIPLAYTFVFLFNMNYLYVAVAMVFGGIASSVYGLLILVKEFKKLKIN